MTTRDNPYAQPVPADNPGGRRRQRRDPDGDTPAAAPHHPDPTPDPTPPAPHPGPPPAPQQQPAGPRGSELANPAGGTLASVLTTGNHHQPGGGVDGVAMLAGLARMRQRPTDPMADYVSDSNRKLRWVQMAINQYAQLTGRTRQEVETAAMLGDHPIPADVLDANWLACYGYPRADYNPQAYR